MVNHSEYFWANLSSNNTSFNPVANMVTTASITTTTITTTTTTTTKAYFWAKETD